LGRKTISTNKAPRPAGPYSQAIVAGEFVFVSGQVGLEPSTGNVPEGAAAQLEQAMRNLKSVLESAGCTLENVVRVGLYLRDVNDFQEVNKVYGTFFVSNPPARTTFQASPPGKYLVEVDAVAMK
jgi:2-iminobutanoate/2-iminopropanoate deaminase